MTGNTGQSGNNVVKSDNSEQEEQAYLEGELQTPRTRERIFHSYKELASYLSMLVGHEHVQINTGRDNRTGRTVYQLLTNK
jgi:hypothetical protein